MADLTSMLQASAGAGGAESDDDFASTVLLLHGDGTNGTQNNTFLDSSTNNFTITRNGNTTQGSFSPFSKPDGRWGNYFDGSGDYLSNTSTALITNAVSTFTVETWVYLTANPPADANGISAMCSLDGQPTGPTNYLSFGPMDNRTLKLFWFDGAVKNATGSTAIALNTWTHIACVVNSNSIQFYVNGVAESMSGTTTLTNRSGTQGNFSIGSSSSGVITGYLSNFRVTTTAVYTTGFTPSGPLTNISNTKVLTCQSNRFIDNSTNAYALTANGNAKVTPFSPFPITTAYDPSVNGGSGYFDGSGDYLSLASDASWNVSTNSFTIEGWIYADNSIGANAGILSAGYNTNFHFSLSSQADLDFWIANGYIRASGAIKRDSWNYVVAARGASNAVAIWVNGTRVQTGTLSGTGSQQALYIGTSSHSTGEVWKGYLSGLKFVNGTDVYGVSNTSITVPTAPPTDSTNTKLLCNFTNAGIYDTTGFNNLETVGNAQIDTTTKKYGTGAMEFDGTGDYLVMKDIPEMAFGTGDFTIETWLYATAGGTYYVFDFRPSGSEPSAPWCFIDSGQVVFGIAGGRITDTGAFTISQNTWYHLAFVRNSGTVYIYVDGVSKGSAANTTSFVVGANRPVIGAANNLSAAFAGFLDDFRITKGLARYPSGTTFTPPTKAFPNIGA